MSISGMDWYNKSNKCHANDWPKSYSAQDWIPLDSSMTETRYHITTPRRKTRYYSKTARHKSGCHSTTVRHKTRYHFTTSRSHQVVEDVPLVDVYCDESLELDGFYFGQIPHRLRDQHVENVEELLVGGLHDLLVAGRQGDRLL
jgi:hypothetical protein